jgi:hypothetical protein
VDVDTFSPVDTRRRTRRFQVFYARGVKPPAGTARINGMKRSRQGSFDTRALEFAVIAVAVYFGADRVREALGPMWDNLSLLLGL